MRETETRRLVKIQGIVLSMKGEGGAGDGQILMTTPRAAWSVLDYHNQVVYSTQNGQPVHAMVTTQSMA